MSTTPIKSAKVRNAVKAALGVAIAAPLAFAVAPASAAEVQLGETTVDIGGFVRMDVWYGFEHGDDASMTPGDAVRGYDYDNDGQFSASARYTRLTFSFDTPTAAGDIGGYIEADFNQSGHRTDGGGLRLRQAYVTYGNWLIGKAWTPFFNSNMGPTVDNASNAGSGMNFGRNWQVRYTFDLGSGSNLAVALEIPDHVNAWDLTNGVTAVPYESPVFNPNGDADFDDGPWGTLGSGVVKSSTPLPALTMRYMGGSDVFSYSAALMVRQIEAEQGGSAFHSAFLSENEDTTLGWGLNVGGTLSLDTGTSFKLIGTYGEGTGQYILSDGLPAVYFDEDGDLQSTESWAVTATIAQQFTDTWSGAIQYSYYEDSIDSDLNVDGDSDSMTGTGQALEVGAFYSPVDPLVFGLSYKYVSYELDVDEAKVPAGYGYKSNWFDGDANRITFTTTYSF